MIFKREMINEILLAAATYTVVTLVGPRQSGKTTLVRSLFPHKPYVNLEAPDIREFAISDARAFLAQFPDGVILDEIQHVPQLLSYIQVDVDEHKCFGKFILTGSHQLALYQAISQSLAGRTAILNLLPVTINELSNAGINPSIDEYMFNGFFPRIYADSLAPNKAYKNYYQTYIERDVRQIINVKDLSLFQKFIKLCAGRIGSVLNKEGLSNEVGVAQKTITQWLSILEASFIIFLLPPYFENFGKRVIKSPKLYFTDVGLASYLLGIEDISQLSRDPLRGFLFENMVILELMKKRLNQGLESNLYYYRDNHQHEVDVIYKSGSQLIPIEIKSAQTFTPTFLNSLHYYKKIAGERVGNAYLIYAGEFEQKVGGVQILNFKNSVIPIIS